MITQFYRDKGVEVLTGVSVESLEQSKNGLSLFGQAQQRPSLQQKGETPVQVNTSFNGNTLFSNSNVMINIK